MGCYWWVLRRVGLGGEMLSGIRWNLGVVWRETW